MRKVALRFGAGIASMLAPLLLAGAAQGPSLAPAQIVRMHSELGYWRTILPYGSEEDPAPVDRAFTEVGDLLRLAEEVRAALDRQPEVRETLKGLRDDLIRLDLQKILTTHPDFFTASTGERILRIIGSWEGSQYKIQLGDVPLIPEEHSHLGDVAGQLAFLPRTGPSQVDASLIDLVRVRTYAWIDLGTLLYSEMLESWEVFNLLLEYPTAWSEGWADPTRPLPRGVGPTLDPDDIAVLSHWDASVPNLSAVVSDLATIEDIVNLRQEKGRGGLTQVRFALRLNREAMQKRYPEDFEQIRFFLDKASFDSRLITHDGVELAAMSYDAQDHRFILQFFVKDGGIVGMRDGEAEEVLHPSKLAALSYSAFTNANISFFGLTVKIRDLPFRCSYEVLPGGNGADRVAQLFISLRQTPKVEVTGALFYFMPAWLLNSVFGVERTITETFHFLTHANDGNGIQASFDFDEHGGRQRLAGELSLEVPDKLLGPIVRDVISREWAEGKKVSTERPQRLLSDLRRAIREDFDEADPRSAKRSLAFPANNQTIP